MRVMIVDESINLSLPPVAEACVQCLILYWHREVEPTILLTTPTTSSSKLSTTKTTTLKKTKLSTLCGFFTYFVTVSGSIFMQNLANQAAATAANEKQRNWSTKTNSSMWVKKTTKTNPPTNISKTMSQLTVYNHRTRKRRIRHISAKNIQRFVNMEHRAYEMRRMWDAWVEQTKWERSIRLIENSCGKGDI